ncbi:hypothetical protein AGATL06_03140 [Agathobaculum sp. TL06]
MHSGVSGLHRRKEQDRANRYYMHDATMLFLYHDKLDVDKIARIVYAEISLRKHFLEIYCYLSHMTGGMEG